MGRVVAYDITRLFIAPLSPAPRGIDRIDLAAAHHFFADAETANVGVLPTPWGIRTYDADRVRRGLAHIRELWAEARDPADDPQWPQLVRRLGGIAGGSPVPPSAAAPGLSLAAKARRLLAALARTGFAVGRPVRGALSPGAVYLNIGQIGLAIPALHQWLGNRPDVAAVFMLHDVIPLDHPEFVEPASVRHHRRMVETAARRADGLIVTTRHAGETIAAALAGFGRGEMPTCRRGLPLADVFASPRRSDPALAGKRYFVVCATIEPRKNLGLLLAVWRRLAAGAGTPPHLVIAGAPGWRAPDILGELADDALRGHVHYVSGLSSPALAGLMLGASAVLCPSLAEGFGLPLLEANALGVPTIASDIAAHREIADSATLLLPPGDVARWEAAIRAQEPGRIRQTPPVADALTEAAYCRDIAGFLDQCGDGKARRSDSRRH